MKSRHFPKSILALVFGLFLNQLHAQRFAEPITLAERSNDEINLLANGDIDGDGFIDLITADRANVYINIASSETDFLPPTTLIEYGNTTIRGVHVLHFDNDGLLDIVIDRLGSELYWHKNLGGLQFGEGVFLTDLDDFNADNSNYESDDYEVGDINGDGHADIVVSQVKYDELDLSYGYYYYGDFIVYNDVSAEVWYLENQGNGEFVETSLGAFSLEEYDEDLGDVTTSVTFADLENDGDLDLLANFIVVEDSYYYKGINDGSEMFTPELIELDDGIPYQVMHLDDIDQDGLPDIWFDRISSWHKQLPDGDFVENQIQGAGGFKYHTSFDDWNGDGLLDLIVTNQEGIDLFVNEGNGNFPSAIRLADGRFRDFDVIGGPATAMCIMDEDEFVYYAFMDGENFTFLDVVDRGLRKLSSIATIDMDNDGDLDLVGAKNSADGLSYFESSGGFNYSEEIAIPNAPSFLKKVIARDVNADGLHDIVFHSEHHAGYMINNGDYSFDDPVQIEQIDEIWGIEVGQLSGNILPEFIITNEFNVAIYQNAFANVAMETLGEPEIYDFGVSLAYPFIGLEDLDGDGDLDIAFATPTLKWLQNNAGALEMVDASTVVMAHTVTLFDFNDDGIKEVVVSRSSGANGMNVYAYNSTSNNYDLVFTQDLSLFLGWGDKFMLNDLNGDGNTDLFNKDYNSVLRWAQGLENGQFEKSTESVLLGVSQSKELELFFHDLDEDGDLDIINASTYWESIRLIEHMPAEPVAAFYFERSEGNNCDIDTLYFHNVSSAYFPHSTVEWDFADGNTSNLIHPVHLYDSPGTYWVELTVCNDAGCDTFSIGINVEVELQVVPDFNIPTEGTAGTAVSFIDNTVEADNWSWLFGDGNVSIEQSPTHIYEAPGTYEVTLYLTNSEVLDCTLTFTETIVIEAGTGDLGTDLNLSISPNPFAQYVSVNGLPKGEHPFQVFDLSGKVVLSGNLSQESKQIDFGSAVGSGLYFIEISAAEGDVFRSELVRL